MDGGAGPLDDAAARRTLERFLDESCCRVDRCAALNDPGVADEIVCALLRTLGPERLRLALECCERPVVLARWSADDDVTIRRRIASNKSTDRATLRAMAADPDELVRAWVAHHPNSDLETRAWLLADPCEGVRDCVLEGEYEDAEDGPDDDSQPGPRDGLAFLHEMVPAAVEFDCFIELDRDRVKAEVELLERELRERELQADEDDELPADEQVDVVPPSTERQALALLRYHLGAVELPTSRADGRER